MRKFGMFKGSEVDVAFSYKVLTALITLNLTLRFLMKSESKCSLQMESKNVLRKSSSHVST